MSFSKRGSPRNGSQDGCNRKSAGVIDPVWLTDEYGVFKAFAAAQSLGDSFGHLTLDRKNVGQFAIKRIRPKMGIIGCFDQLHVHAHRIAALLHASFQDVSDAKLPCDVGQVFGRTFIMLRRCARNNPSILSLAAIRLL
jgi:hypothetical protein